MDDISYVLRKIRTLVGEEFKVLIETDQFDSDLASLADSVRKKYYKTNVYLRDWIEFTNYCKNNCFYCGIRNGNQILERYQSSEDEVLNCYEIGHDFWLMQRTLCLGEAC